MKFFKFLFFATIVATMFITSCGKGSADGEYSLSFEVPDSVAYSFGVSMASILKQQGVQSLDYDEFSKGMKKGIALKEEESNLLDSALNSIEAFAEEFIQGERVKIQADSTYVPALMDYPKAQSYDIGMILGDNLTQQNYGKAEVKQVVNGLKDALNNSSKYTPAVTSKIFNEYLDRVDSLRSAVNEKYLADNKEKKGVITTPSGLQYEVLKEGSGDKPSPTSQVKVDYKGTFVDGKTFDSSYDRGEPVTFPLNGVIAGWTEGVGLMSVGSKYEFTIPYQLGYGEQGYRGIPGKSTLVFEVELLEILPDAPQQPQLPSDLSEEEIKKMLKQAEDESGN